MTPLRSAWAALLARRAVQVVALALLIGTLCFFMARALPGDVAMRIAASRYGYDLVGNAAAAAVRAEPGLDQPLWRALADWWGTLARLDLDRSPVSGDPVWHEVRTQLGATIDLVVAALLLATAIGLPLGAWAGLHAGGRIDRATLALAVLLRAMPPFLMAVLLMLLVAVPVVAYLGVHAVFLVEGAVVVESLFAWPGIGHALVHAIFGRDVPMIQGAALCMGLLFVVFNLPVDAACLALDPRRRLEEAR